MEAEGELVRHLVVASGSTRLAVVEAIRTQPDIQLRLAETAVPFALTALFQHFTLHAAVFVLGGRGGHGGTVARRPVQGK